MFNTENHTRRFMAQTLCDLCATNYRVRVFDVNKKKNAICWACAQDVVRMHQAMKEWVVE